MVELSEKEALQYINDAETKLMDVKLQAGNTKAILKYRIEPGYLIENKDKKKTTFTYFDADDEPLVTELIERLISHYEGFDKELEKIRWGLVDLDELDADEESFGGCF